MGSNGDERTAPVRRSPDRPTARPVLRPGLRVYRRDDAHLQVGIDQPRVVLPDTDGVRTLLGQLRDGAGLGSLTPDAGLALGHLLDAGLVVDRSDLASGTRGRPRAAATAAFAAHGPEAPTRLAARSRCRVEVIASEPWLSTALERLVTGGLSRWPPPGAGSPGVPEVTLLVSAGQPARSRLDRLVRADRTHLLVTLLPDRALLGPFVVPGVTACLRCVDAELGERDPRRSLVLEQVEEAADPCEPGLAHAALALAVRELTSYAEGDRPATWSATLTIGADLSLPCRGWRRHPHCGCSWA